MQAVLPADVPALIPGAPPPEPAHLLLAQGWLLGELALRRVDPATLTGTAETFARTAWAAKALAYKTGLSGTISLTTQASTGGLKGIKVPGLELTLNVGTTDTHGTAVLAAADWDTLAGQFVLLAAPQQPQRRLFVGVSR
ncbi:hypothetical protein [Deinococcus sp. Leaf326]|uniref:hypothetical protein n=1 Tax=Deinococcus sp. Leaf326 TaxID=1736338 RepID=UPI0007015112|nr:hypothetical protein [Deinococcus sp. Leaf326]KQR33126.1 hypothetical protein ASF71_16680 [Deinococcus sp. Leaf326]